MSNRYPCPNPICVHEFEASQLVGAAAVTCPRCGMTIQLQAQPEATVPMARPVATASPAIPMARAAVPMARPVTQPAAVAPPAPEPNYVPPPVPDQSAGPILRTRKGPKGHDWLTYVALIAGFLVVVGAGVGVVLNQMRGTKGGMFGGKEEFVNTILNIRFPAPSGKWDQNTKLRDRLDVNVALQRPEPAAWFALGARDFVDHNPSPKELDEEARKKLDGYFKNVDTDPPKGAPLKTADAIAGQPASMIVFQGEINEEHVSGEVHCFSYQGIGYWVYTWKLGTVDQRDDKEFPAMRKKLALLGERAKWKDILANRKTFTGKKGYKLTDPSGRWRQEEDDDTITEHDPAADMVLFVLNPKSKTQQEVQLIVMCIPNAGDPIGAAKKHILAMQVRAFFDMTTITDGYEAGDKPKDSVGAVKGHLLRWLVQNTPDRIRFAVVGVVPHDKDLLILYADCPLDRRNAWENQFQSIMETIQLE